MNFFFPQLAFFMKEQRNIRNLRMMLRFFLLSTALVLIYASIFHGIMLYEGREYSLLAGLYWALTVMSTLGFGDITFHSDLGRLFTIVVMLSGLLLFMFIMPFVFIRYIYMPWIEAQAKNATPRTLAKATSGHTILVGSDPVTVSIADKLRQYSLPFCVQVENNERAFALFERGYPVVLGDHDDPETYRAICVEHAALIVALKDDLKNTNIAATVREVTPKTRIAASAETPEALSVLALAGCTHVFNFPELLGKFLARRVFNTAMQSNIIGRFEGLCIAESPAYCAEFFGKKLQDVNFRKRFGLNVAGIWHGRRYQSAGADTVIEEGAVLLLIGTDANLKRYDQSILNAAHSTPPPVLILGGGRVGRSVATTLEERGIAFSLVDRNPKAHYHGTDKLHVGNASDYAVLEKAGINQTQTVVITTHNDDLNIYLAIYCRKLRPDIQIICRATFDRNIASMYSAGASLVMSQASLTSMSVLNLLLPNQVLMLSEGLNIFRARATGSLAGKNLIDSGIRQSTGCNVVAISTSGDMDVPPDPHKPIAKDSSLILIGTKEEEARFCEKYGVTR